jgi:hypothetical protein
VPNPKGGRENPVVKADLTELGVTLLL